MRKRVGHKNAQTEKAKRRKGGQASEISEISESERVGKSKASECESKSKRKVQMVCGEGEIINNTKTTKKIYIINNKMKIIKKRMQHYCKNYVINILFSKQIASLQ